jgi:hypothetical protein
MLRCLSIPFLLVALPACGFFGGGDGRTDIDTAFSEEDFFLNDCDIVCNDDGLDLEIEAFNADAAEVEFFSEAVLVETFILTQLDDETWVAYPDWPAGYGFADCGADADFVCVVRNGSEEIRESR